MRSVVAHIVSCILLAGISLMTSCREDEVIILAEYERLPLGDNSRSENADDWKLNDTWEWVDLSELGQIASIYFTMESSDTGDYGINTPTYFCLDKLTVSTEPSSVEESVAAQMKVYYDRSNGAVRVESAQLVEAAVYNMSGTLVMKQLVEGSGAIDMSAYPAGVYVVRCGGYSTKIVK